MANAKMISENPLKFEVDGVEQAAKVWSCNAHNPKHSGEYVVVDGKKWIVRCVEAIDPHNCPEWIP